jgi:hypothetical protein
MYWLLRRPESSNARPESGKPLLDEDDIYDDPSTYGEA